MVVGCAVVGFGFEGDVGVAPEIMSTNGRSVRFTPDRKQPKNQKKITHCILMKAVTQNRILDPETTMQCNV